MPSYRLAGFLGIAIALLNGAAVAADGLREIPADQVRDTMLPMTRAEVVSVDPARGTVTLNHRRIEEVDLPAGENVFRLDEAPDFKLAPGERVLVIAERRDSGLAIRRIKPRYYD